MSAYNRRAALRSRSPSRGSSESEMNESGYTSFRAPLNSTAGTPFLLEDAEGENCRNASNTSSLSIRGLSTPSGHEDQEFLDWGKPHPRTHPQRQSTVQEESFSMTPRLLDAQSLPKRRKKHFQPPHSSPKKSKKLLFPLEQPQGKNRFYGGVERLDIVAKLAQTEALECILRHVSAPTLDVMTKVSLAWKQAVYRSQRNLERLQNHRLKLSLTKENSHVPKRRNHVPKANKSVPLQTSNHSSLANSAASLMDSGNSSFHLMDVDAGRVLREQTQRVKCPRCGRGSRVFVSEAIKSVDNPLSQTLPIGRNNSTFLSGAGGPPLKRFLSLDLDEIKTPTQAPDYNFAECTSVICQFRFCVNCLSKSHPGERCLVTELDTPSKLMMPRERQTPPHRGQNRDPKIRRKNSLKRLCF
ncbi:uncharacterized protein LOC108088167 [Drosophila ficusphila]|uniref:uncharacterized protein LOC108088167 n=1 Tax=Drosophila ficusphila TaxID=30025 RepID=UPI0007E811BB|nr:uncharacterized protein LOC108088167 [Drosophila ficusphila]